MRLISGSGRVDAIAGRKAGESILYLGFCVGVGRYMSFCHLHKHFCVCTGYIHRASALHRPTDHCDTATNEQIYFCWNGAKTVPKMELRLADWSPGKMTCSTLHPAGPSLWLGCFAIPTTMCWCCHHKTAHQSNRDARTTSTLPSIPHALCIELSCLASYDLGGDLLQLFPSRGKMKRR